jgi:hypothetical protein
MIIVENVLTAVFALEVGIAIVALGFVKGKKSYIQISAIHVSAVFFFSHPCLKTHYCYLLVMKFKVNIGTFLYVMFRSTRCLESKVLLRIYIPCSSLKFGTLFYCW